MRRTFSQVILSLLSITLYNCLEPDNIRPEQTTFKELTDIPKLLPYQTATFSGNKYPGIIDNYKVYFGDIEVPITQLGSDSISVFIPSDIEFGILDVSLVYKESKFPLGNVEIIDWNTVSPHNVSYYNTGQADYPYHITDSLSNSIIPYVRGGQLKKIFIIGQTGKSSIIELNYWGLPSAFYSKEETVIFGGYDFENFTVNIARFPTGEVNNAVYQYGIPLNSADVTFLMGSSVGNHENGKMLSAAGDLFTVLGTVLDVTGCVLGVGTTILVPPTFLAGSLTLLSCGSAAYNVLKFFDKDKDNKTVSAIQSVHGLKMNLINCLKLSAKPKNAQDLYEGMYGCYGSFLEAAKGIDILYEEWKLANMDVQKISALLSTGYGDIKITLDWNSTADLDLWVISPNGEKIYYNAPNSSTGGELDIDDQDGYGPENIYWPTNEAPFGKYTVQVHYFGPDDGPTTSYRVIINNFGNSKTFSGSLSFGQVVTVAQFEARAELNNSVNKIDNSRIMFVGTNSLPPKR